MKPPSERNKEIGKKFSSARKVLSLSQKDIANKLNLQEQVISALDVGDFHLLLAPAYVKGYIRCYAKAVNLDADELIKMYENMDFEEPEILPDVKPQFLHQIDNKDSLLQLTTYIITFIVLVLFIAWWRGQYIVNDDVGDSLVEQAEVNANDSGAQELGIAIDKVTTYLPTETLFQNAQQTNVHGTDSETVTDEVEQPIGLLEMELTSESWIEVYDVRGIELYRNLVSPPEKISVTGYTPLSVKLGNVRAVSVYFNGEFFDTADYRKTDIAQFILE